MELLIVNLIESILMSIFMTSLITLKEKKNLCRLALILANFIVITVFNYIEYENLYLTTILIFMNTCILKYFSKKYWYEVLFIPCLESLFLSFTASTTIFTSLIFESLPMVPFSKVLYFVLMFVVIKVIKSKEIYFNKIVYLTLSVIILFLQFVINQMSIFFTSIYDGYNDVLLSYFILLLTTVLILYMIIMISDFCKKEEKYHRLKSERENIEVLNYLYKELKVMKHDFKHDLNLMEHQLMNEKYNELLEYITSKKNIIQKIPVLINSKNELINTIINNKIFLAHIKEISVCSNIVVDDVINMNEYDLNDLLSNILDNAIENTYQNGNIQLNIIQEDQTLNIRVENTIKELSDLKTKKDKKHHGFGLTSIERIAERYNGKVNINQEDNKFILTCTLLLL